MTKRRYSSPVREKAAAEKRERTLAAAAEVLASGDLTAFSLDAVAQRAGVTRLTVYNQFGSRSGLLEAVFDDRAMRGGLGRIASAMAMADAQAALRRIIEIFCEFWESNRALGPLHAAISLDPEFAAALEQRNERRRRLLTTLVTRLAGEAPLARRRDAVDMMFVMTGQPAYASLRKGRSTLEACRLITHGCEAALRAL
jgi:AcrR family transcriptional regulator